MSDNNKDVLYQLYEIINPVGIRSESGETIGTLQVGERVYARADTLKTTKTNYPEWMSTDTDTEIQHERGWSMIKSETNDREDGYKSTEYMKLVDTVYGSPDQYPSAS